MHRVDTSDTMFYRSVIDILDENHIDFMIGGAFAYQKYTGIYRDTKDIDVFCQKKDIEAIFSAGKERGYEVELTDPRWLAKLCSGDSFADFLFNSNNCLSPVDDTWFAHAQQASVLQRDVLLMPIEEIIWTKAFVCERDRFDGSDIAHLILLCAKEIDWRRLFTLMEHHWQVLYIHLQFFIFIYPQHKNNIPLWLLQELSELFSMSHKERITEQICNGTLFSPTQYRIDVHEWGYSDGRPC